MRPTCPRCSGFLLLEYEPVQTVVLVQHSCINCGHKIELACLGDRIERDHQPLPLRQVRKGSREPRRTIHSRQAVKEVP